MASFMVPQRPKKNDESNRHKFVGGMWNPGALFVPQVNSVIPYSPCGSSSDGSESCYIVQQMDQVTPIGQLYSRKVFVGGLPPDISEDEIIASFQRFGSLTVNWPQKGEKKSVNPPKGYAFLIFEMEQSVQNLVAACHLCQSMLYYYVSSNNFKNKAVQVRPWSLADTEYIVDKSVELDYRKTVFVGGVPRPLKAIELACLMNEQFGNVRCVAIDTDAELQYPKGAARVTFSSQESYVAAINVRFVTLSLADIDKRVELKPYVLGYQKCDECEDQAGAQIGPFFCANTSCLKYYCELCWAVVHDKPGREYHKPVVKEWADRPRKLPYRWC